MDSSTKERIRALWEQGEEREKREERGRKRERKRRKREKEEEERRKKNRKLSWREWKFNCREKKRELRVGPDWEKEPGRWRDGQYVVIESGTGNSRGGDGED